MLDASFLVGKAKAGSLSACRSRADLDMAGEQAREEDGVGACIWRHSI